MNNKKYYDKTYFENRDYNESSKTKSFEILAEYLIEKYRPKKTLELACGKNSMFLKAMTKKGIDSYAVDISEYVISTIPEHMRHKVSLVDINSDNLPFCDKTFDMVISLRLFEHIQNLDHAISETFRVLKPHGILFITVPTTERIRRGINLRKLIPNFTEVIYNKDRPSLNYSVFSKKEWIEIFEKHRFTKIEKIPCNIHKEFVVSSNPGTKIGYFLSKYKCNFLRKYISPWFDWFEPITFEKQ